MIIRGGTSPRWASVFGRREEQADGIHVHAFVTVNANDFLAVAAELWQGPACGGTDPVALVMIRRVDLFPVPAHEDHAQGIDVLFAVDFETAHDIAFARNDRGIVSGHPGRPLEQRLEYLDD